jgi:hypothetical protein
MIRAQRKINHHLSFINHKKYEQKIESFNEWWWNWWTHLPCCCNCAGDKKRFQMQNFCSLVRMEKWRWKKFRKQASELKD